MGINLPTQTGESGGGTRPRASLPPSGDYEVLRIATDQNNFGDDIIQLTLMNNDTESTLVQSYKYKLVDGKIAATTGGGRLRTALDEMGLNTWDIEGLSFRFEPKTFTLQGGPKSGTSYDVFLPVSQVKSSAASGSSNGSSDASGYSEDGVAALLTLLGEPITQSALFKAAADVPAISSDKALLNDIATQKAFTKIPGIKKEGNKYFVG